MKSTLLHIDTSPRIGRSQSRGLGADFLATWQARRPQGAVTTIDLTKNPVPLVSSAWVEGAFTAPEGHSADAKVAMAQSNAYVDQLLASDQILITTPVYNLSIPAALKAWIDQVVRVGRTFTKNPDNSFTGLVTGRKMTVVVSSGSDLRLSGPGGGYNFVEPYLRAVFGFIGITDITFVYGHSLLNVPDQAKEEILATARHELQTLAVA